MTPKDVVGQIKAGQHKVRNVKTRQSRYFAAKAQDERFVFKYCSTRGYLKQASVISTTEREKGKRERESESGARERERERGRERREREREERERKRARAKRERDRREREREKREREGGKIKFKISRIRILYLGYEWGNQIERKLK